MLHAMEHAMEAVAVTEDAFMEDHVAQGGYAHSYYMSFEGRTIVVTTTVVKTR